MTLDELYKMKGRLSTENEIIQAQLQQVNQLIIEALKKQKAAEPKEENKDA